VSYAVARHAKKQVFAEKLPISKGVKNFYKNAFLYQLKVYDELQH